MKNFRTFGAAFVLTLVLSATAFAGHIECGVAAPPPPAPSGTSTPTASEPGDTAGHIEIGVTSADPVTEAALSLLQVVITLL